MYWLAGCLLGPHTNLEWVHFSPHHRKLVVVIDQEAQQRHHTDFLRPLLGAQHHCILEFGVEHLEEHLYYNIDPVQVLVLALVLALALVPVLALVQVQVKAHATENLSS